MLGYFNGLNMPKGFQQNWRYVLWHIVYCTGNPLKWKQSHHIWMCVHQFIVHLCNWLTWLPMLLTTHTYIHTCTQRHTHAHKDTHMHSITRHNRVFSGYTITPAITCRLWPWGTQVFTILQQRLVLLARQRQHMVQVDQVRS